MKTAEKPTVETRTKEVIITRFFDAPKNVVYRVWTEPEHIRNWWGPRIMQTPVADLDLRAGGKYRIVMRDDQGVDYDLHGAFKEVTPGESLEFTTDLSGHPQQWKDMLSQTLGRTITPQELQGVMRVNFQERDGKTKVTITTQFASDEVRDAFLKTGMVDGWTETLEKFEEQL